MTSAPKPELRDRFWENVSLEGMSAAEGEALCDGCGNCCLHKFEDEDTGEIADTNVACRLLDCETARCRDYANRKTYVPDCLRLTRSLVDKLPWLPETCAYRRRAEGRRLPRWHYLLTGSRDDVHRKGAGVAGRVISETKAGPLEHHIVEWEG